ncbi:glutaredoxin [Candidatus Peregrinibacteria bacterium CG_4_9_14_0_2_um_filter_41_14]|nr:MAG: glutaredoxin [Candidatus Peregrinibacteria bacterium CG_4_10_14_0_2_um_filter_41_8]PJC38326.1 MAG: glutaredoxin [Candidatus Peregrinibacteria bacterium CG_4_9_14_0_2_um_filter_41_14]
MLILFHKEECPYCAKVRTFMSDSSVSYVSLVCPNGSKSRAILEKLGGKQQVPFLVDTDAGEMMYESDDIIEYVKANHTR